MLRKPEADSEYMTCRVILIKWVVQYMHRSGVNAVRKGATPDMMPHPNNHGSAPPSGQPSISNHSQDEDSSLHDSSHHSLDSSKYLYLYLIILICFYLF